MKIAKLAEVEVCYAWAFLFYEVAMDNLKYGDITNIGIASSGVISIEFYDPHKIDGTDYTTIYLTIEQASLVAKLGDILNGKTA